MASLLITAGVAAKAVSDALRSKPQDNIPGEGSRGPGSKFNDAPNDPKFDAYQQHRRGTGAHDMTVNRALAVKRFAKPIVRPIRPIQQKVLFKRQVGPQTAAWIQHMLAEAMPADPPFYGESKAVSYKRRLVAERMPRMHPGWTYVDREPKEWNKSPMPMYYPDGHPFR